MLSTFTSQKFRFYSFLSMFLLVFVHGYNLNNSYLQPFTPTQEPLTITGFIEYWLANGLFRFRIPMLFIISGYLFAMHDERPYAERMKKRLRTLGLPYLIWSAVGLLITFALQQHPFTAAIVKTAQLDQMGDNRPYTEIGIGGIAFRWILVPIAFQLWFIRSLLVYNAAYPLLKAAVLKAPKIWFIVVGLLWYLTMSVPFIESEGLLFFTLGIFLQKKQIGIEQPSKWLQPKYWAFVFIGVSAIKTVLAFYAQWNAPSFFILSFLHKITVFSGLVTMWYGCNGMVRFFMEKKWFVWVSAFSFIIYALHVPLINYCLVYIRMYVPHFAYIRLTGFLLLPLLIILLCVIFGALLRAIAPKVYSVATGGRGL